MGFGCPDPCNLCDFGWQIGSDFKSLKHCNCLLKGPRACYITHTASWHTLTIHRENPKVSSQSGKYICKMPQQPSLHTSSDGMSWWSFLRGLAVTACFGFCSPLHIASLAIEYACCLASLLFWSTAHLLLEPLLTRNDMCQTWTLASLLWRSIGFLHVCVVLIRVVPTLPNCCTVPTQARPWHVQPRVFSL